LKQAIANECYGGDSRILNTQSIEQLLADNTCARQVQLSATRTAAHLRSIVQRQAQAFETVIRAMRRAAGIRHLIVMTDGIALSRDVQTMAPVARAAAESGVQMSVLMATGDISLADAGRRTQGQADTGAPQRRREDHRMFLDGARLTADMAGGEFSQVTGAPDRTFERVRSASSAIYRLAVEAPRDTTAGTSFTLAARVVTRQGVTARAHRHAIAAPPADTAPAAPPPARAMVSPAEQMRRSIASGRALTDLAVAMESSVRRAADHAQVAIDVAIVVSTTTTGPIETMFGLVNAGKVRTSDKTLEAPDPDGRYRLSFSIPVAPGAYRLRFAAADAAGAVGAIETPVDATLTRMGPIQTSGLSLTTLAGSPRTLVAALELYPPADAPAADLIVKMAIVAGSEIVTERVVVSEAAGDVLRAEAEFVLETPPPEGSVIRATVLNGATVLGATSRPLPR
jgi:hypothetical protein